MKFLKLTILFVLVLLWLPFCACLSVWLTRNTPSTKDPQTSKTFRLTTNPFEIPRAGITYTSLNSTVVIQMTGGSFPVRRRVEYKRSDTGNLVDSVGQRWQTVRYYDEIELPEGWAEVAK